MEGDGVRSESEYADLAVEGFKIAQQQFITGVNTGVQQERQRIIHYLLEKNVIRESMIQAYSEAVHYVGLDNETGEGVDLSFEKSSQNRKREGRDWLTN